MTSLYQTEIKAYLEQVGRAEVDPRHVEAYMRLGHGTLDGLTGAQFDREIKLGLGCVDATPDGQAEQLARSYGL